MKKCIFILSPSFPVVSNKLIQYFSISSNGHHKQEQTTARRETDKLYIYLYTYIYFISFPPILYVLMYLWVFSRGVLPKSGICVSWGSFIISHLLSSLVLNRFDHLCLCPPNLRNISPSLLPGVSLFYESVHDLSSLHSEKHNPSWE